MKSMLVINQGKFNFCHQYLQTAVHAQYPVIFAQLIIHLITNIYDGASLYFVQRKLATHFQKLPFNENTAHELPWILSQMVASQSNPNSISTQQELVDLLLDLNNFSVFGVDDYLSFDLLKYLKKHICFLLAPTNLFHKPCLIERYWHDLKEIDNKWEMGEMYFQRASQFFNEHKVLRSVNTIKKKNGHSEAGWIISSTSRNLHPCKECN
jgi:hypothetical protein